MTAIRTPRLIVRSSEPADADTVHAIFSDPEAMRYIPGGAFDHRARCERWVTRMRDLEAERGYAMFAVIAAASADVLGFCGLVPLAPDPDAAVELAYHLKRTAWGMGYATEAARAVVDWTFANTPLTQLLGLTFPAHVVSQRVLTKVGFTYRGLAEEYGMTMKEYVIGR